MSVQHRRSTAQAIHITTRIRTSLPSVVRKPHRPRCMSLKELPTGQHCSYTPPSPACTVRRTAATSMPMRPLLRRYCHDYCCLVSMSVSTSDTQRCFTHITRDTTCYTRSRASIHTASTIGTRISSHIQCFMLHRMAILHEHETRHNNINTSWRYRNDRAKLPSCCTPDSKYTGVHCTSMGSLALIISGYAMLIAAIPKILLSLHLHG